MKRLGVGVLILCGAGCSHSVTIPPAGQDTAPGITMNAFVVQQPSGYSGDIEPGKANVGMTSSVAVTEGAKVQFSGSAKNPGGVQQFNVTVKQSGQTLYQATTTSTPDANGQAPDLLSLLGTNGAGGPGNQPMLVSLSAPVIVTATATNFHAMSQTITVTYNPVSSNIIVGVGGSNPAPPPSSAQLFLSANHDLGPYQTTTAPPGLCQATLTWTTTPVSLTGPMGSSTPFVNTATANPAPTWFQDPTSGLYTARCGYGQMVGNLRTGTWTVSVSTDGAAGGPWQAQCQAALAVGTNGRTFQWGQPGCH